MKGMCVVGSNPRQVRRGCNRRMSRSPQGMRGLEVLASFLMSITRLIRRNTTPAVYCNRLCPYPLRHHTQADNTDCHVTDWPAEAPIIQRKRNDKEITERERQNRRYDLMRFPPWSTQVALPSFFFCLRGGVTGRPIFMPPYGYLAFFSAGFKIWKEHSSVSSTLIIAPALSNSPQ